VACDQRFQIRKVKKNIDDLICGHLNLIAHVSYIKRVAPCPQWWVILSHHSSGSDSKMPQDNFRLGSKNIFLTYAQSDFNNEELCTFLVDKLEASNYNPLYVVVSRELHEDGNPHHHALIQLGKKPSIRNSAYFDYNGKHPNIQPAPKPNATLTDTRNYVIKDGDFYEEGEFNPGRKRGRDGNEAYAKALKATSKEEFTEIIESEAPRDAVIFADKISAFATKRFRNTIPEYSSGYSLDDFNLHPDISDWLSKDFMVSRLGVCSSLLAC